MERILDVFELKRRKPVLVFRISIVNNIIIHADNANLTTKVSRVINEPINQYFDPIKIGTNEKREIDGNINFKFIIKKKSKNYYYLSLSREQQVELALIDK